jgi:hypothetical protein
VRKKPLESFRKFWKTLGTFSGRALGLDLVRIGLTGMKER